jgi:hypothetical protein
MEQWNKSSMDIDSLETINALTKKLVDHIPRLHAEGVTKEGLYAQRDELMEHLETLLIDTVHAKQFQLSGRASRVLMKARKDLGGSAGLSMSGGPSLCLDAVPSPALRVIKGTFRKHVCPLLLFLLSSSAYPLLDNLSHPLMPIPDLSVCLSLSSD